MKHDFKRTTCACGGCVACCKRQPGSLIDGDFERIVTFIKEKNGWSQDFAEKWVMARLWASPGALILRVATGKTQRVGTITPRFKHGRCVFLNDEDRCDIHPVAPFGCAYFDTHMIHSQDRSLFAVDQQQTPAYQALRNRLPYATHYNPTRY